MQRIHQLVGHDLSGWGGKCRDLSLSTGDRNLRQLYLIRAREAYASGIKYPQLADAVACRIGEGTLLATLISPIKRSPIFSKR